MVLILVIININLFINKTIIQINKQFNNYKK